MRLLVLLPRAADGVRVEFAIPLTGFVFGFVVGRWWTIAAAAPFGAYIAFTNPLEGDVGTVIALMLSLLLAFAIGSGVALRRLRRRQAH
jgi:hypothetical protein